MYCIYYLTMAAENVNIEMYYNNFVYCFRKMATVVTNVLSAAGALLFLLCQRANSVELLILGRLLVGLSGGELPHCTGLNVGTKVYLHSVKQDGNVMINIMF